MNDAEFRERLATGLRWRYLRGPSRHAAHYPAWFGWTVFSDQELLEEVIGRLCSAFEAWANRRQVTHFLAIPESGNPYMVAVQSHLRERGHFIPGFFMKFAEPIHPNLAEALPEGGQAMSIALVDSGIDSGASLTETTLWIQENLEQAKILGVLVVVENDLNVFQPSPMYRALKSNDRDGVISLAKVSQLMPYGRQEFREWDATRIERFLHLLSRRRAQTAEQADC